MDALSVEPAFEVETIRGDRVWLRPAIEADRRAVFEWMAESDVTPRMMGPPLYPESPAPTWDEARRDRTPNYFDDSSPEMGRTFIIMLGDEPAGAVSYNDIQEREGVRGVELDIWMRSEAYCGRGLGTEALDLLCQWLRQRFDVTEFMVQPSSRNPRAIGAYEKLGFQRIELSREVAVAAWGPADYVDSVFMVRRVR